MYYERREVNNYKTPPGIPQDVYVLTIEPADNIGINLRGQSN